MTTSPMTGQIMVELGDIVHVDFAPIRGREQAGARPALVISPRLFHEISELALVCPITRNRAEWPFKVMISDGEAVEGAVLVDHIRSVHRASRGFRPIGKASPELMANVRNTLANLTGLNFNPNAL